MPEARDVLSLCRRRGGEDSHRHYLTCPQLDCLKCTSEVTYKCHDDSHPVLVGPVYTI